MTGRGEFLDWRKAFRAGPNRCGGKGGNLARLDRYGFDVPAGGVLTAEAYVNFMAVPGLARLAQELSEVKAEEADAPGTARALGELRAGIESASFPERDALADFLRQAGLEETPLAIRSSAVSEDGAAASFAGIHRSFLNQVGLEAVERSILACYASLWTPQALAYRRRMGFSDADVRAAVVLCEMVRAPGSSEPAAAGVAFSGDPRTGRRDLVVIDAARGLGEKVVSGTIEPDHVEIRMLQGKAEVERRTAKGDPVLSPAQETELAGHVWRIHGALGDGQDPQDVEWAHDGRRFWFVQARPVTRMPRRAFDGVRGLPVTWSTANIKDAVPGVVSALAWSLIQASVERILYAAAIASGYEIPRGLETVRRFDGHAYFDLTAMQWAFYDSLGVLPSKTIAGIGGRQPEIPVPSGDPLNGPEGKRRKGAMRKLFRSLLFFKKKLRRAIDAHFRLSGEIASRISPRLSTSDLLAELDRLAASHDILEPLTGLANAYGGGFLEQLDTALRSIAGDRASALAARLLSGSGTVTSAEMSHRIEDLAAAAKTDAAATEWLRQKEAGARWTALPPDSPFRLELERFLREFGHRAVYEADLLNPRWSQDPGYLLDQVRRHLESDAPTGSREKARRRHEAAWEEVRRLTFWRRPILRWLLKETRAGFSYREAAKSAIVASMGATREIALEVGRRLVAAGRMGRPDQVFHLTAVDLVFFLEGKWDGRGAGDLAADREARRNEWLAATPPDLITEGGPVPAAMTPPALGEGWRGTGVSPGRVTARARIILHPDQGAKLGHGEVLVAPSTDPGWTPIFLRAGAVVMETGGLLSHGAIVARELGLPAVVNVSGILETLADGETVTVDGDTGRVARAP